MRPYGSFVSGLFSPEGDLDMALDGFLDYKCEVFCLRGFVGIALFMLFILKVSLALQQHKLSNSVKLAPHDGEGKVFLVAGMASRRCPSASRPRSSARTCCGWGPFVRTASHI